MSMSNLGRALHEELCGAFPCRYRMVDLDLGDRKVAQYGHNYPREFWEGVAQAVKDDYGLLGRTRAEIGQGANDARVPTSRPLVTSRHGSGCDGPPE